MSRKSPERIIRELEGSLATQGTELDHLRQQAGLIEQQRNLLDRACASYIERQAAEKAASGLISLAVATAWANEQRLVISAAMQQITAGQEGVAP